MAADCIPGFGDITENETETFICILVGEKQIVKQKSYQIISDDDEL